MQYKKILFVIDVMNPGGGAQKVLPIIMHTLQSYGVQTKLLVLKKTAEVVPLDGFDVEFIIDEGHRLVENSFQILDILSRIAREFELLCSFMDFITCYFVSLSAKIVGIPYYAFVRCEPSFVAATFPHQQINHELYSLCLQGAQKVVCNSKSSLVDVEKNFGVLKEKLFLLYNPIGQQYVENLHNIVDLPAKKQGEIFCFAVGRLHPKKNYLTLLEAFLILQDLPIRLFILGDGEQRKELENFIKNHHLFNVTLLGYRDNIYPFLQRADIFVHSSLTEGFPNSVLEAAYFKKPLILSDIMPHKDFFATMGAVFFEPENVEDLAMKIKDLANDRQKRDRLAKEAFTVIQNYQKEGFEKQLRGIFGNIGEYFIR